MLFSGFFSINKSLKSKAMIAISVYHQELDLTLAALALKVAESKAVILLQDRIHVAELVNGIWTISRASKRLLDLCDII